MHIISSFLGQLKWWPCQSLGYSMSNWMTIWFQISESCSRDVSLFRQLFQVMRRHDTTKKKTNSQIERQMHLKRLRQILNWNLFGYRYRTCLVLSHNQAQRTESIGYSLSATLTNPCNQLCQLQLFQQNATRSLNDWVTRQGNAMIRLGSDKKLLLTAWNNINWFGLAKFCKERQEEVAWSSLKSRLNKRRGVLSVRQGNDRTWVRSKYIAWLPAICFVC